VPISNSDHAFTFSFAFCFGTGAGCALRGEDHVNANNTTKAIGNMSNRAVIATLHLAGETPVKIIRMSQYSQSVTFRISSLLAKLRLIFPSSQRSDIFHSVTINLNLL
jgi:hypothetical protein